MPLSLNPQTLTFPQPTDRATYNRRRVIVMPRATVLQTRVESAIAAQVRVQAERAHMSASEWIAAILKRELSRPDAANALAPSAYELLVTLGYMLRALMIESMGAEPAETAIQDAAATAADEAATELRRATEIS